MDKMLKIVAIALFVMGAQNVSAQQNTMLQEAAKVSRENHKRIDDRTAELNEEQKAMEFKKTLSNRSAADQKGTEDRIAQIKAEKLALEEKNRKLAVLENGLNATNEKMSRLAAEQDAEYKKNGSTSNEAILKQRAIAKENLNNLYQLQVKQEAEIKKAMSEPN